MLMQRPCLTVCNFLQWIESMLIIQQEEILIAHLRHFAEHSWWDSGRERERRSYCLPTIVCTPCREFIEESKNTKCEVEKLPDCPFTEEVSDQ
jgi:hypothetical protein